MRVAIVGGGLAGFVAHATLRHGGIAAEEIAVFGLDEDPAAAWRERAAAEGRFRVEAAVNGAEQVICATGFLRGYAHDPLLRRLVEEHALETEDRWIVLAPDSTVPSLTDATRTLALAGAHAQWSFPAADTLVGAKYAAHRFLRRVQRCRTR